MAYGQNQDRAQIVVFASQKGGSGKTTVSAHIAVEAERRGAGPVAIIDTDPQGSMAKWWNARKAEAPAFAHVSVPDLVRDITALEEAGYRLIIIDTPPAVTSTISEVVGHADLVIVPTRPSPHDLRAVGPTVDIAQVQSKPLIFVVNSATARARITGETAIALSQHGCVAPATLHHRVDFAASMIDGRTVGEANPAGRSAAEVSQLWTYLDERLKRLRGHADAMLDGPVNTFERDILSPVPQALANLERAGREAVSAALETPETTNEESASPRRFGDSANSAEWDGVDRRKADHGPPPGKPERRVAARQPFGRRFSASNT
ncbi:MAG: ParA family protein [Alphaproteobacteria bacterium]|nr:ParA family protein [Alphaproteobacteria bacterium]